METGPHFHLTSGVITMSKLWDLDIGEVPEEGEAGDNYNPSSRTF